MDTEPEDDITQPRLAGLQTRNTELPIVNLLIIEKHNRNKSETETLN